jgi:NAD(P)H-nitrite reductase large subunit
MKEATRYVIAGGSAAGMAAAQAIAEADPGGSITIFSDEKVRPYFRPMIPFVISGTKKLDDILLEGRGPYRAGGMEVRLDSPVEAVDTDSGTIQAAGAAHHYDRLLLATGSRAKVPPEIGGTDADGVYTLRYYSDSRAMAERCVSAKKAVMAGGGLLNLKATFALRERGVDVTLVVRSPAILSQLMEPGDSFLLKAAIADAGVKVVTGRSVTEVLSGKRGVTGVLLDSGEELPCDLVCIGKGVAPIVDYLEGGGIDLDGGIVVDRFCETNVPGVFAAGDVGVTSNPITGERVVTGLWTNAVEMGRCAGRNMAGSRTAYTGTFGILNATQIGSVPFVSMGIVHTTGGDFETHVFSSPGQYRKVVFSPDGSRLVGALFIGSIERSGLYRYIIRENRTIERVRDKIIDHDLHYGDLMPAAPRPR